MDFLYEAGVCADPDLLPRLLAETRWETGVVRIFGRSVPMPRLLAWYGPVPYRYSGHVHAAAPLPALLEPMRARVEALTGRTFNTVLLNLYRDGRDSMGWHHDDDYDHGGQRMIASVSLGATRRFLLKARHGDERRSYDLEDGSLLLMGDRAQERWLHAVPKTRAQVGPRVNLTWRHLLS